MAHNVRWAEPKDVQHRRRVVGHLGGRVGGVDPVAPADVAIIQGDRVIPLREMPLRDGKGSMIAPQTAQKEQGRAFALHLREQ